MHTNRDLYRFVTELGGRYPAASLERYLCALWSIAREHRASPSLPLAELASLLERAYTAPSGEPPSGELPDGDGFVGWERCIVHQIHDLRAMAANGQLADDQRYFGIDSPRGSRWYNFHPAGYLECATVGTFGGWDGEEDSSRVKVPGKVVGLDAAELIEPVAEIEAVDWDTFTPFLSCGQCYE